MFCLSFLVAFPKKEKQKAAKKARSAGKKSKPSSAENTSSEPPLYKLLDIGVKSTCAIKYSLFDGFQYQVDVCSWGQPGKIYAGGASRAVKCLQTEKLSIVCFSIYHAFAQLQLEQDDIIKLLNQSVSFKFFDTKAQMSAGSQKDAPKHFYDSNEANDKNPFTIIYEGKTANGPDNTADEEKITFESLSDEAQSTNMKVLSKLRGVPLGLHRKKLLEVIESLDNRIEIGVKQGGSKKSDRSTGKSTPKSARSKDNNMIGFSCTELLLDELMIYYEKIKPAKQIEFVAVIVSAKDIMLQEIRESLFPFFVEIRHIKNLPSSDLSLTHVFLKYSLESVFSQETDKIEVTQDNYHDIEFNYSKVLFVNRMNIPFSIFVEALQTGLFCIELYGVTTPESKKDTNTENPSSQEATNKDSATPVNNSKKRPKSSKGKRSKKQHKENKSKSILLAVTYVNLGDMLKSSLWTDYNIHLTTNHPYETWWGGGISEREVIPLGEGKEKLERATPYFKQKDLIESGTIIKVRLRNGDLIQPPLLTNILSQKEILSRMIIVFHDNEDSNVISDTINLNNRIVYGEDIFMSPRYSLDSLMSIDNDNCSSTSEEVNEINYISGFFIDTIDKKFLMVEGLSNFKFSKVLGFVSRLKKNKNVKIFFNSSFVFTQRLYPNPHQRFTNTVKLKKPLSTLLQLPYNVLKRKVSQSVLKAIMKLKSIMDCYTMLEVCVQKLFPSPEEIFALKLELGDEDSKNVFSQPQISVESN